MYLLLLLHIGHCIEIQISGNVAFDLKIRSTEDTRQIRKRVTSLDDVPTEKPPVTPETEVRAHTNMTEPPRCRYQCPKEEQIQAIISHMMNELAKVFSGVSNYIKVMVPGKATRFHVISNKENAYFETVFTNMTADVKNFQKTFMNRSVCAEKDPCQNQEKIKEIWRDLLELSRKLLANACRGYILDYAEETKVPTRSSVWEELEKYLVEGLNTARANQLAMLCEHHNLCYSELL